MEEALIGLLIVFVLLFFCFIVLFAMFMLTFITAAVLAPDPTYEVIEKFMNKFVRNKRESEGD